MSAAAQSAAVLFDLDGTLLDTAPDMVAALNQLRREESCAPLPYAAARAYVSHGVLGLLNLGFGQLEATQRDTLRQRFIEIYSARLTRETRLFDGMEDVLRFIENSGRLWGVVTNKPTLLTEPLLEGLGLRERCACVVCGDTTPHRKPHPGPLLYALERIGVSSADTLYVGDAERDIAAGRAAGTLTATALYGYIPPDEAPGEWPADFRIRAPIELLHALAGSPPQGTTR